MSGCLPLSRVLHAEYNHLFPEAPLDDGIADDLDAVVAALHKKERTALCISGGGIRSATFALGILQGLAGLGKSAADSVLAKIDYLSTVSGGGYVGSWLSAWCERRGSMQSVIDELRQPTGDKLRPEPQPLRHLREFSNYLTPKLGLLSADTWTFFGTYFRNLLLTLLVLVPLFVGVLALPRLFISFIVGLPEGAAGPWIRIIAVALFTWALLFLAFTRPVGKTSPEERLQGKAPWKEWLYTNGAFQLLVLVPFCIVAVALIIGHAWFDITDFTLTSVMGAGAGAAAFASLIYSIRYWRANVREERDDARPGVSLALYTLKKQLLEIVGAGISGALFGALVYGFLAMFGHTDEAMFPSMTEPSLLAWMKTYPPELSQSLAAAYVVFGVPLILLALILQSTVFVGGTSWYNEDFDREWWGRGAAWVFIAAIGWIVVTAVSIYGPVGLYYAPKTLAAAGGVSGLIATLVGRSGKTSANKKKEEETMAGKSASALLVLAVPIFVLILLAAFSLGTTIGVRKWLESTDGIGAKPGTKQIAVLQQTSWSYQRKNPQALEPLGAGEQTMKTADRPAVDAAKLNGLDHLYVIEQTPPSKALIVVFVPILLSLIASIFIGVNRFSMHALYRDRLIRAYLGASNEKRSPNPFTGFDPRDNIPMDDLRLLRRPIHVVNMTLNLVAGEKLAWQERKAESFTASPLHCGSLNLGYRPSAEYGGPRGMTLGTAVGISGAAASPNMGYNSSPALAFLLTFFNVRLGWWLGNPGPAGDRTYDRRNPRASLRPLLAEVFGNTDASHPYVYLSDGGHFENLGFYEMVLRRCRRIIISDAGADQKFVFSDLGNAIRKIYIDFGIRVRIDRMGLFPRPLDKGANANPKYCATGKILYSEVDAGAPDGEFVYIKPVFYGDEPHDIYNYAMMNEAFPHESTGDQWFSESQFESYRALGNYTVQQICEKREDVNTVQEFIAAAQKYAE